MRIAVVTWTVGHNPVSRGWYLADLLRRRHTVELIGPLSARGGSDVWLPIRAAREVPIRSFDGHDITCYLGEAERFSASVEADLVYVSKPRFPGALLGELVSARLGVPLVLDIDDEEQGIADEHDWMRRATPELIDEADAVTVVSEPLQRRYGGTLVGQARDERLFDPERYDRQAERARLGYGSDEIVILFAGTPRRHKGLLEVAQALVELGEPRLRLCIVGSIPEMRLRDELAGVGDGRVQLLDYRPIAEVPHLLAAADLVCLAQDPGAPVARDQVPMKLTEALSMSVPVLATATPALAPYIRDDLIFTIGDVPLAQRIGELLADPGALRERADRGREHFLAHLSYRAVGGVLESVFAGVTGPRDRPRWTATVALAREQPPCPLNGPVGHAKSDRELTAKLIEQLAREARIAVNAALRGAKRCALLGYPNHGNPGDHAIWLAAKQLLRQLQVEVVYVCDWQTYSRRALTSAVESGAVILLTGGGNLGDLWPNTQGLRERVLADFRGVPTVQLPQSVQFDDAENRDRTRVLLERHGNVMLMLRDRYSLERSQEWFAVPAQLVPDLAFAAPVPAGDGNGPVADIVWIARDDKESVGFEPPGDARDVLLCDWMPPPVRVAGPTATGGQRLPPRLVEAIERSGRMTELAAAGEDVELSRAWDELSRERLALACSVLRRGRIVVTDRLHAHVMALHLGLPSVVADNSYGKVSGTYDTYTEAAPIARWARTPEDALAIARMWLPSLDTVGRSRPAELCDSVVGPIPEAPLRDGSVMCPVCRLSAARFEPFGAPGTQAERENALCPNCRSLERHRLAWLYLVNETDVFEQYATKAVLYMSSDRVIYHKLREEEEPGVLSLEMGYPMSPEAATTPSLEYKDATFDAIFCSHVLERVPDDRLAIRELCRVLRPAGFLMLQTAVLRERTVELGDGPDRHGGPHGRLRAYGPDLAERLAQAPFEVKVDDFAQRLGPQLARRYGVPAQPPIFYCVRR